MKFPRVLLALLFLNANQLIASTPTAGFFLPDSVETVTFEYNSVSNFVILKATINDTIHVNLMLDTGCRNVLLFGKRFSRLISKPDDRKITFSGLGNGKETTGFVSLENDVSIDIVKGKRIPIVVVPERNVFRGLKNIDGVVGYEIFTFFEVKINFPKREISFTAAPRNRTNNGLPSIPLRLEDAKPVINSTILLNSNNTMTMDLLIDTGSSLALLVTADRKTFMGFLPDSKVIGKGFNGDVIGTETISQKLKLHQREISEVDTGIIFSDNHRYASIGTAFLKDYILVLNYASGYAALELPQ